MKLPLFAAAPALLSLAFASCSRPNETAQAMAPTAPPASVAPSSADPTSTAAATASFKFATQTLSVPAGFSVELVAGPPLVNRPISIAFDEKGRLYATDSSGFSDKADKQIAEKPHRIVRLEDRDDDGRFEHATVFADRMMFPQGALFHEGSLYVAAPPHIWKLTDTDDDGVADRREIWYDGKTLTGCANDLHGPYLGPDGWFYWTKGAFAEQQHTLPNGKPFVTRAAHIFRSRADGSRAEPVLTGGMDNPVGVTFTASGERVLCGTFFQIGTPGKRDGLIHAIYGGVYGKDQPAIAGHIRTGDLMPIMTHMGAAAPCGITTYRSGVFGRDFADNLFVCYFNLRKISRHELVPDGATFRTRDADFVTSDSHDFHPTDVLEDADGSLLVADTGGWYKICCPTSQLAKPDVLGGIYRIRKTGAPAPSDPRGRAIAWDKADAAALIALLSDHRPYVQERAMQRLATLGTAAVPRLKTAATSAASPQAARNALWTLARIDAPEARAANRLALSAKDAGLVRVALQAASLWSDAGAADSLRALLATDDAAQVRLAAEALGRIGDAAAVDALLGAAKRLRGGAFSATGTPEEPAERVLEHALVYALIEIGRGEPLLAQLAASRDAAVVRVALLALNQIANSGLKAENVIALLESNDRRLKQTAGWVVGHHPEWGDSLSGYFRRRLAASGAADERAALEVQLAQMASAAAIQDLLAETAADTKLPAETRTLALRAMVGARLKVTPARWLSDVAGVLADARTDRGVLREAVATARALPLPRGGHAALATALARTGRDAGLPAGVRLDALAATPPAVLAALEPELFDFVRAHLDPEQPILVRSAAAAVLAHAPLSGEQQLALADTLAKVTPLELPKLLPAFERKPTELLGRKVVGSLRGSTGLSGVRAANVKTLFARYPQPVQHEAEELVRSIDADALRQNARVDELLPAVAQGDIRRGQAVFNSTKAGCTLCHMMGHLGGRLGPDLTAIGRIRSERELLEAVVFPSATFVRGFEPFTVITKGGAEHSGILRKDTPEEVVLATGVDSEQRVARSEVREMKPAAVSPMPPGMDVVLGPQEIADLVAFLKSRQ